MKSSNRVNVDIIDEEQEFHFLNTDPGPSKCIELFITIGDLSRRTGVSPGKIRKWAKQGLIPFCRRRGEHRMFPEARAIQAVQDILRDGGLK